MVALAGVHAAQASSDKLPIAPAVAASGAVSAPPTTAIALATTTTVAVPTHLAPTTRSQPRPAPPRPAPRPAPAPLPAPAPAAHTPPPGGWYPIPEAPAPPVTRPHIDPDDNTPVGVLPGETPITAISTAISTVPDDDT
jgi:hypothetical protein